MNPSCIFSASERRYKIPRHLLPRKLSEEQVMLQKTDVNGGVYSAEHRLASGVQASSHRTG